MMPAAMRDPIPASSSFRTTCSGVSTEIRLDKVIVGDSRLSCISEASYRPGGAVATYQLRSLSLGEIIDVKAEQDILTNDRPDIQKIRPILFGSGDRGYHGVGQRIGDAFKVRTLTR